MPDAALPYGAGRAQEPLFYGGNARIAGFPALARNGLPDSFLFQDGALPSVVIAGILRADAVPEKPLPRAGVYRDRIVDKKIPPFCGGIFTCN